MGSSVGLATNENSSAFLPLDDSVHFMWNRNLVFFLFCVEEDLLAPLCFSLARGSRAAWFLDFSALVTDHRAGEVHSTAYGTRGPTTRVFIFHSEFIVSRECIRLRKTPPFAGKVRPLRFTNNEADYGTNPRMRMRRSAP